MFGVYYIATELCRHGIISTVTSRNTEKIDILASNIDGTKAVTIQVKTRQGGNDIPVTSYSNEPNTFEEGTKLIKEKIKPSPNKFYAFVSINKENIITYYIEPSKAVLNDVLDLRKEYLSRKVSKRTGKRLKDCGVWAIVPKNKYKNKIDFIKNALR